MSDLETYQQTVLMPGSLIFTYSLSRVLRNSERNRGLDTTVEATSSAEENLYSSAAECEAPNGLTEFKRKLRELGERVEEGLPVFRSIVGVVLKVVGIGELRLRGHAFFATRAFVFTAMFIVGTIDRTVLHVLLVIVDVDGSIQIWRGSCRHCSTGAGAGLALGWH